MKICPDCQKQYPDTVEYCPDDGNNLRTIRKAATDPLIGRLLDGRWFIEAKIGEGGMGAVYRGHQRSVDRKVAIKTLRPSLSDNESFVNRFFREAKIATSINHPHCVTILDFGQSEDETLYLAMEYLEGTTLAERMTEPLVVEKILRIGLQIASALSAAHQAQIVHRDLKPDNIFLLDIAGGGTFVKVLDFGIAKVLNSETQFTQTGQIFGTPDYMSPEQCQGGEIDGRADLYALGCILYELFGGRPPFRRETPMAILMAHVFETVEPMPRRVPAPVENLVMKLLAKAPADRYEDAAQVRTVIEEMLATLDSALLAYTPGQGALTTLQLNESVRSSTPPAQLRGPLADTEETTRRDIKPAPVSSDDDDEVLYAPSSPWPKVLGASALALVLIAAGVFALTSPSGESEEPQTPPEVVAHEATAQAPSESAAEESSGKDGTGDEDEVHEDSPLAAATEEEEPPEAAKNEPDTTKTPPRESATSTRNQPAKTPPTTVRPATRDRSPAQQIEQVFQDTNKVLENFSREVEEAARIQELERTRPPAQETKAPATPTPRPKKKVEEDKLFDFFGE